MGFDLILNDRKSKCDGKFNYVQMTKVGILNEINTFSSFKF